MSSMFYMVDSFNQSLGKWDVSRIKNIKGMFQIAISLDQPLGSWNVSNIEDMINMFDNIRLSTSNYNNLLIGWSHLTLQHSVTFDAGNSKYSSGPALKQEH